MDNSIDLLFGFGKLSEEFNQANLGNRHRTKRFLKMLDAILENPSLGFPQIFPEEADIEGAYRFLRNPAVTFQTAIAPHYQSTVERCKSLKEVVVIHDTTECSFGGSSERDGLGYVNQSTKQGFFSHFALASTADGRRIPLGVLGVNNLTRPSGSKPKKRDPRGKRRESLRWAQMVDEVEERMGGTTQLIHLMDREGDIYPLFDELTEKNRRFVIRACHDRVLGKESEFCKISEALKGLPVLAEQGITVSNRKTKTGSKAPPARKGRQATVKYSATTVVLKRPGRAPLENSKTIRVNLVHAEEVNAEALADKVEWVLVTSEPIETPADVIRVVELYRGRWLIEEYFKAIKTGCKYEERQLESLHTLLNALALIIPVAHRLLSLRAASRLQTEELHDYLTDSQIKLLQALPHLKVPPKPSTNEALLAIARLGGHIKNNGDPGWQVLWRGYQRLLMYEIGWNAKSDQS
jgi:hypothetical protein